MVEEETENSEENERNSQEDNFSEEVQNKLLEKLKGITYTVNSETIDGDNAKVNVTVKGMDLNIVLGKVMQEATFGSESEEEITVATQEMTLNTPVTVETESGNIRI